jgi:glycosyltransferase involved in cell wall biosynthesis
MKVVLPFKFNRSSIRKPIVSLIIPTLNEVKNLPLVLPYIPTDIVDEVILVDGLSTDHTVEVARNLLPSIWVILEKKKGKGIAMRRGYAESSGDILVVIDADGSHDPREIPRFVQALLEGADFVKGSRFAPSGGTTDMPFLRKAGNWALTSLVNILFSQTFTDLCYGFHAFWRHCLDYLNLKAVNGFEVDTSIYLQAVRNRLKVVDVPSFEGLRFYGNGKLQTFPDGLRVLRTILREWVVYSHEPIPTPSLGFRSYNLRTSFMQPLVPVTGSTLAENIGNTATIPLADRKRYSLEELLYTYVKNTPKEQIEPLLSSILVEVVERVGASSGSLLMLDDELHNGNSFQVFGRTIKLVPNEAMNDILRDGIAGWAIQNHRSLSIPNTASESHWLHRDWEQQEKICRSAAVVPFFRDNKGIGILILARPEDRCFTEDEIQHIKVMEIIL